MQTAVYRYYHSGVHIADLSRVEDGIAHRTLNRETMAWSEWSPLGGEDGRYQLLSPISVAETFRDITVPEFRPGPDYTRHKKVMADVDGQPLESWIWVQSRGLHPQDFIEVDGQIVGMFTGASYYGGVGVLIRAGYEGLSPLGTLRDSASLYGVQPSFMCAVPMRDGIELATEVYLPANLRDGQRVPAILARACYGRKILEPLSFFVHYGYAVVLQDVRGREESQGLWEPCLNETNDGDDTLNWIAAQPWYTGGVGMMGRSYLGLVQWAAAASGNPQLKAQISMVTAGTPANDFPHRAGMLCSGVLPWTFAMSEQRFNTQLLFRDDWEDVMATRPLRDIPRKALGREVGFIEDWLSAPVESDYWKRGSWDAQADKIDVPTLYLSGWYDDALGTYQTWHMNQQRNRQNQRMILGPWRHGMNLQRDIHDIEFGPESIRYDLFDRFLAWYDRFLKNIDNGAEQVPLVEYFTVEGAGWAHTDTWPPAAVEEVAYYLSSGGQANTRFGDGALRSAAPGDEPTDHYDFDPKGPAPHLIDLSENDCMVPENYAEVETRPDVLVYTTAPLARDVVLTGSPRAVIYAASSARDTDWVIRLTDVDEDGRSIRVSDGLCRARYRHGIEAPALLEPGKIEAYTLDMTWISIRFKQGHRIRVEVTSGANNLIFPNPNTGGDVTTETEFMVAHQTLYHDAQRPSRVILPIMAQQK